MIRFTRMAFGFSALALTAFMMTACAEGGQTDTADDTLDTTSEVISADGVEGKVFVEFTISETGEVTNAHVIEPLHPALDSAAIAAAEAMPAWAPATKEGQPIATTITLPIFFKQ